MSRRRPASKGCVIGDAATRSRDSRDFGAVSIEAVVGRVFYVLSSRRIGVLPE